VIWGCYDLFHHALFGKSKVKECNGDSRQLIESDEGASILRLCNFEQTLDCQFGHHYP